MISHCLNSQSTLRNIRHGNEMMPAGLPYGDSTLAMSLLPYHNRHADYSFAVSLEEREGTTRSPAPSYLPQFSTRY